MRQIALLMVVVLLSLNITSALGGTYEDGEAAYELGDFKTALKHWMPIADERGHADAQRKLGFMYQTGRGVPRDYEEARKWYLMAAKQSNALARLAIAGFYEGGRGVAKDPVLAYMWRDLASKAREDQEVAWFAGVMRDRFAEFMTPEQIATAQRLSKEWQAEYGQ